MSMFNDLLHSFKETCDEKDEEIKMLKNEIDFLRRERAVIIRRFEEGEYELLANYFNIGTNGRVQTVSTDNG